MTKKKLSLSVIVPFYNEIDNINLSHEMLTEVLGKIDGDYEIIYVNDGSKDGSVDKVKLLEEKDERVFLVDLSRNFGKEIALAAGLQHAHGNAAIMIDCDMQHPPEKIPAFIDKWQEGYEVVVGVRKNKDGESAFKKFASKTYYNLVNKLSETEITPNATDFRMIDGEVIDAINVMSERNRMTRSLIDWMGFKRSYVEFQTNERAHGEAQYSFRKLLNLASNSFVSMSSMPLKLAAYIGFMIMVLSGPLALFMIADKFVLNDPFGLSFSNTASLAIIIIFLSGLILMNIGIAGYYIAQIHSESLKRPLYIARANERQ